MARIVDAVRFLVGIKADVAEAARVETTLQRLQRIIAQMDDAGAKGFNNMTTSLESFHQMAQGMKENTVEINNQRRAAMDLADAYRHTAKVALSMGGPDARKLFTHFNDLAKAEVKAAEDMRRLNTSVVDAHKSLNFFGQLIADPVLGAINKLGFGLFILKSSFNTIIGIGKSFSSFMQAGGGMIDSISGFGIAAESAGIDSGELAGALETATAGVIPLNEALKKSTQLFKAGLPEISAQAPKFMEIAIASAVLSGNVGEAGKIYDTLITGIVRNSPRLIDNADIILKVGDAHEKYAASIGKTADELTVFEQKTAVSEAIKSQGQVILDLAEKMDPMATKVARMNTRMQEWADSIKMVAAELVIGDQTLEDFQGYVRITWEEMDTTAEKTEFLKYGFSSFANTTKMLGAALVAVFAGAKKWIGDVVKIGTEFLIVMMRAAQLVRNVFVGDVKEAAESMVDLAEAWGDFHDVQEEITGGSLKEYFGSVVDEMRDAFAGALEDFGLLKTETEGGLPGLEEAADDAEDLSDELEKVLERMEDLERDFFRRRADNLRAHNRNLADIQLDYNRDRIDAYRDYTDDLAKAARDRIDKISDIEMKHNEKMADISQDLEDDIEDAHQEALDERQDAEKERNHDIEKAAEDHQRKLAEIEKKFQVSRINAVLDRDARALWEAQNKRDEDIANLADDEKKKREEIEDAYQEELKLIEEKEQDKIDEAQKAAERKRRDADRQREREMRDLERWYDEQKKAARRKYDDELAELARQNERKRQDEQINWQRVIMDTRVWYQRELYDLQLHNRDILQEQINSHVAQENELIRHHNRINSITGGGGGGGGGSGGGGGGGHPPIGEDPPPGDGGGGGTPTPAPKPSCPPRAEIVWHRSCNVITNIRCTGADGNFYWCVGGANVVKFGLPSTGKYWLNAQEMSSALPSLLGVASTSTGQSQTSLAGISTTSTTAMMGTSTAGGAGTSGKVTIVVRGDDTLEQIFRSIAYDAFVEVIG